MRIWASWLGIIGLAVSSAVWSATVPTVLVLGDSLSAGYGIATEQGWVALLEQKLKKQGRYRVVNASISGETTAGGLARLSNSLQVHKPRIVIIELGANDGLRALPVAALKANLTTMIQLARRANAVPVLLEMRIPSNYGPRYTQDFTQAFSDVAQTQGVRLVPFFLRGFAADPQAFQDDGIHPSARVQSQMLDAVWPTLAPLLP